MSGRFTSEQLKKIAMGTMFIDHAAVAIIYGCGLNDWSPLAANIGLAMRLVGRMAFPLYAFMLVQGFMWTRDWKKYLFRMTLFALAAEIPFDLVLAQKIWYPNTQNTLLTLTVSLVCLKMLDALEKKYDGEEGKFLRIVLNVWVIVGAMTITALFRSDGGAFGLLLVVLFYLFRHRPAEQAAAGCAGLFLIYGFSVSVLFAWIAIFFISRYNGERGRKMGLLPYIFYPAHLLAVWLAGWLISGI